MPDTLHSRALKRAAELLGGVDPLCTYLRVSAFQLERWMRGEAKPPDAIFLKLVDVLARQDGGDATG
jgi:hypothetical protein